jgi:hypothetical protein
MTVTGNALPTLALCEPKRLAESVTEAESIVVSAMPPPAPTDCAITPTALEPVVVMLATLEIVTVFVVAAVEATLALPPRLAL